MQYFRVFSLLCHTQTEQLLQRENVGRVLVRPCRLCLYKAGSFNKVPGTGEEWGKGQEFELELVSVSSSSVILPAWWVTVPPLVPDCGRRLSRVSWRHILPVVARRRGLQPWPFSFPLKSEPEAILLEEGERKHRQLRGLEGRV